MPTREKNQCSARAGCRRRDGNHPEAKMKVSKQEAERTSWVKGNTGTENGSVTLSKDQAGELLS